MIHRLFLMLGMTISISANVAWIDFIKNSLNLNKSVPNVPINTPKNIPTNIDNTTGQELKVEYDQFGRPVVIQKYALDDKIVLKYFLMPKAYHQQRYQFPQDFMIEIPHALLKQDRSKSIDQISLLGTHNSFTNPFDGFLYFQQQNSILNQVEHGGVRMLRPAWHNPSGSIIDTPNKEPILCHADDDKCATASLATRGFQPHKTVKEFNNLLMLLLKKYPDEVIIVGINNYLTPAKTDAEIEKIPNLSSMAFTLDDLHSKKYQAEWNGSHWPTLDWMIQNNKRVIFLNDVATRYTIDYETYVRRNQYGTASIATASKSRTTSKPEGFELFEMSWFQNVSLPLHEINALQVGVELYWKVMTSVPTIFAQALNLPRKFLGYRPEQHQHTRALQKFINVLSVAQSKAKKLLLKGIPNKLLSGVHDKFPALQSAIKKIEHYVPVKQDNSLETLCKLLRACRTTEVLLPTQIPNIVMLDFATTTGDGIVFVNLMNMLMDQKLKIQFVDVGGFCYQQQQVVTNNLVLN